MKKIRIIFTAIFSCILFCVSSAITSFAATEVQDGLEVALLTDKENYNLDEKITANLTVTNTNDFEIINVSLENFIPNGYKLSKDCSSSLDVERIKPNEKITLKAVFIPDTTETIMSVTTVTEEKTSYTNSTTKTNSVINNSTTIQNNNSSGNNNTDNEKGKSPYTGDESNIPFIVGLLVISSCSAVILFFTKRKTRNTILSLILCFATTEMLIDIIPARALESKSISISETVIVNNKTLIIKSIVNYNVGGQESTLPVDEYYLNNSEKIVSVEVVDETNTLSEAEVFAMLTKRGFVDYPITYSYDMNGKYVGEAMISENSAEKHPMYQMVYETNNGEVWSIYVIGKSIITCPVGYLYENCTEIEYLFSETNSITSYDDNLNEFYMTVPKNSIAKLIIVDNIDAETIAKYTYEELDKI